MLYELSYCKVVNVRVVNNIKNTTEHNINICKLLDSLILLIIFIFYNNYYLLL